MALCGTSGKAIPLFVHVLPPFAVTNTCDVPYPPKTIHTLSSFVGLTAKSITKRSGKMPLILTKEDPPLVLLKTLGGVLMCKLLPSLSYCAKGEVETYNLF